MFKAMAISDSALIQLFEQLEGILQSLEDAPYQGQAHRKPQDHEPNFHERLLKA
jgi:hypothetical protein